MPEDTVTRELRSIFTSPDLDFDPGRDLVSSAKVQAAQSRRRRAITSGIAATCLIAGSAAAIVVRDDKPTNVTAVSAFDSWPTRGQGTFGPAALDAWRASKPADDPTRPTGEGRVLFADDVKDARAAILISTSRDGARRVALVVGAPGADTESDFELVSERVTPDVDAPHHLSAVVPSRQWRPDVAVAPAAGSLVLLPAPGREGKPIDVQLDPDAPATRREPFEFDVMEIGSLDPRQMTIRTFDGPDRQVGPPTLAGVEHEPRGPARGEFLTPWAQPGSVDEGVVARATAQWKSSRREGLIAVKTILSRTLGDGTALVILEIDDSATANHLVLYAEPPGDPSAGYINLGRDVTSPPKSFVGWVATGKLPNRVRSIVVVGPETSTRVRAVGGREPIEVVATRGVAVLELPTPRDALPLAVTGYDAAGSELFTDSVLVPSGN